MKRTLATLIVAGLMALGLASPAQSATPVGNPVSRMNYSAANTVDVSGPDGFRNTTTTTHVVFKALGTFPLGDTNSQFGYRWTNLWTRDTASANLSNFVTYCVSWRPSTGGSVYPVLKVFKDGVPAPSVTVGSVGTIVNVAQAGGWNLTCTTWGVTGAGVVRGNVSFDMEQTSHSALARYSYLRAGLMTATG